MSGMAVVSEYFFLYVWEMLIDIKNDIYNRFYTVF